MVSEKILFKLRLGGNGIVNFDSIEQKRFLKKYGDWNDAFRNDNLKFCKKSFELIDNGEECEKLKFKVKIDSACLRYNIFKDYCSINNPKVTIDDKTLATYVASRVGIIRGYLFQNKDNISVKRESCLSITSAVDLTNQYPYMEIHNNFSIGGTTKKDEDDDKKKTSLYFAENVGEILYETKGSIDLMELQFMSCSPQHRGMAFMDYWLEGDNPLFEEVFQKHYGRIPYEAGYYNTNPTCYTNQFAERGIMFDDDFVREMVSILLTQIRSLFIERATSNAYVIDMQAKIVTDGFSTYDDKDWVSVNSKEELDKFLSPLEIKRKYPKVEI